MASLELYGFESLQDALTRLDHIPEQVIKESLDEMAEVAMAKIRAQGESMGVRDPESGVHILDKLSRNAKAKKTSYGGYTLVTFTGSRRRGKKGTETRNAEIAFVTEYGRRNMRARPFIGLAMNKYEEAITDPAEKKIGAWIESEFYRN